MELQLALALPVHNPVRGFDLNDLERAPKEVLLEGSEPWSCRSTGCLESEKCVKNKRSSEEAFGKIDIGDMTQTLPVMLWSGQPNEDDDRKGRKCRNSYIINKKEVQENNLVGWPPITSWRKKQLHQHQGRQVINNDRAADRSAGGSNSPFVKVKMEGVLIARKINIRLYHSYQTLTDTLISMFAQYQKNYKDGASYALTYQDKEGDWLLAGDVPWQTFIESVRRLEILRNGRGCAG